MKKTNKQKQQVALEKCTDKYTISFTGVGSHPAKLKAFRSYVNHLNKAGLRNIKSTISKNMIYYTADIKNRAKRDKACHFIQLNARLNKVTIPQWIGNHARIYRTKANLPTLINYPTKQVTPKPVVNIEDLVTSKVTYTHNKKKVTPQPKTSLWHKLFGWLSVKDF